MAKNMANFGENSKNPGKITTKKRHQIQIMGPKTVYKTQHIVLTTINTCRERFFPGNFVSAQR